jgi:DNA-binding transcriptional LysR family regulator
MLDSRERLRWDDVEIFCQLSAHGSLRRAAQSCGQSLETIRRRINALEVALGERLFRRTSQGLQITAAGRRILAKAREAHDAISAIARISGAERRRGSCVLRLSLPEDIGALSIVPALRNEVGAGVYSMDVRLTDPALKPDWDCTDIGLCYSEPQRADLRRRKVGEAEYGLFRRAGARRVEEVHLPGRFGTLILPPDSHPIFTRLTSTDLCNWVGATTTWRISSALALRELISGTDSIGLLPGVHVGSEIEPLAVAAGREFSCSIDLWIGFHADVGNDPEARALIDRLIAIATSSRDLALCNPKLKA